MKTAIYLALFLTLGSTFASPAPAKPTTKVASVHMATRASKVTAGPASTGSAGLKQRLSKINEQASMIEHGVSVAFSANNGQETPAFKTRDPKKKGDTHRGSKPTPNSSAPAKSHGSTQVVQASKPNLGPPAQASSSAPAMNQDQLLDSIEKHQLEAIKNLYKWKKINHPTKSPLTISIALTDNPWSTETQSSAHATDSAHSPAHTTAFKHA
jgi:hypothetical protein